MTLNKRHQIHRNAQNIYIPIGNQAKMCKSPIQIHPNLCKIPVAFIWRFGVFSFANLAIIYTSPQNNPNSFSSHPDQSSKYPADTRVPSSSF